MVNEQLTYRRKVIKINFPNAVASVNAIIRGLTIDSSINLQILKALICIQLVSNIMDNNAKNVHTMDDIVVGGSFKEHYFCTAMFSKII